MDKSDLEKHLTSLLLYSMLVPPSYVWNMTSSMYVSERPFTLLNVVRSRVLITVKKIN